jgi:hypothetical protein
MPQSFPIFLLLLALLIGAAPEVWAQDPAALPCEGADCAEVTRWGAWGLIFLGAIFFAVWFVPPRRKPEEGGSSIDALPMMAALQRRIDKELSGWRRFQWPLMGLFFIGLGLAVLFGWI